MRNNISKSQKISEGQNILKGTRNNENNKENHQYIFIRLSYARGRLVLHILRGWRHGRRARFLLHLQRPIYI